jgi:hypothetical protein
VLVDELPPTMFTVHAHMPLKAAVLAAPPELEFPQPSADPARMHEPTIQTKRRMRGLLQIGAT